MSNSETETTENNQASTGVTEAECQRIRSLRREGLTKPEIEQKVGVWHPEAREHYIGECDHHDNPDPLLNPIREFILGKIDANGGKWLSRSAGIADEMETNATVNHVAIVLKRIRRGDDPEITAEKWGGKKSRWVLERRDDANGGDSQ